MTTVVEVRSNSRYSGRISCETETGSPVAARARANNFSWAGFTKEKSRQTATESAPLRTTARAIRAISALDGASRTRPSESSLSRSPRRRACGTSGSGLLEQQIVKLRARLPANFENVFEARGRHEGDAPAFSLKKGVRANRGPADEFEAGQIRAGFPDSVQRMSDRIGWFARRGWDLQNFNAPAAKKNTIGECAAGIKRDAHENGDCIASWEFAVESWVLGQFQ